MKQRVVGERILDASLALGIERLSPGGFKMVTLRKLLVFAAVAFAVCAGPGQEGWSQTETLTAFYTAPVVSMAPIWIAKEAGFFRKQGLEVKLVFIPSGPTGTAAILSGQVDVGVIGGFAPIRAILGGAKDLVIIGQSKNAIVATIVGRKEIAGVQDLKGKRLGIDRIGSNPDMFTQAALSRFHMDPLRDLQYIQMGNIGQGIPALKAGAIDALTTNPPDDLVAERLGFKVILDITAMKIPFAATVLVSARSTVARKHSALMKFMRAYAEAVHYLLTNREGAGQVIAKYTKVQDKEVLNYSIETDSKAVQKTSRWIRRGLSSFLG